MSPDLWVPAVIASVISLVGTGVATLIILKVSTAVQEKSIAYLEREVAETRKHYHDLREEFRKEILNIHTVVIKELLAALKDTRRSNGD